MYIVSLHLHGISELLGISVGLQYLILSSDKNVANTGVPLTWIVNVCVSRSIAIRILIELRGV